MPGQINMPRDYNLTFADGKVARLHAGLNNVSDEVLAHPYFAEHTVIRRTADGTDVPTTSPGHAPHLVVGSANQPIVRPELVQPIEPAGSTWNLRAPPGADAGVTGAHPPTTLDVAEANRGVPLDPATGHPMTPEAIEARNAEITAALEAGRPVPPSPGRPPTAAQAAALTRPTVQAPASRAPAPADNASDEAKAAAAKVTPKKE